MRRRLLRNKPRKRGKPLLKHKPLRLTPLTKLWPPLLRCRGLLAPPPAEVVVAVAVVVAAALL